VYFAGQSRFVYPRVTIRGM